MKEINLEEDFISEYSIIKNTTNTSKSSIDTSIISKYEEHTGLNSKNKYSDININENDNNRINEEDKKRILGISFTKYLSTKSIKNVNNMNNTNDSEVYNIKNNSSTGRFSNFKNYQSDIKNKLSNYQDIKEKNSCLKMRMKNNNKDIKEDIDNKLNFSYKENKNINELISICDSNIHKNKSNINNNNNNDIETQNSTSKPKKISFVNTNKNIKIIKNSKNNTPNIPNINILKNCIESARKNSLNNDRYINNYSSSNIRLSSKDKINYRKRKEIKLSSDNINNINAKAITNIDEIDSPFISYFKLFNYRFVYKKNNRGILQNRKSWSVNLNLTKTKSNYNINNKDQRIRFIKYNNSISYTNYNKTRVLDNYLSKKRIVKISSASKIKDSNNITSSYSEIKNFNKAKETYEELCYNDNQNNSRSKENSKNKKNGNKGKTSNSVLKQLVLKTNLSKTKAINKTDRDANKCNKEAYNKELNIKKSQCSRKSSITNKSNKSSKKSLNNSSKSIKNNNKFVTESKSKTSVKLYKSKAALDNKGINKDNMKNEINIESDIIKKSKLFQNEINNKVINIKSIDKSKTNKLKEDNDYIIKPMSSIASVNNNSNNNQTMIQILNEVLENKENGNNEKENVINSKFSNIIINKNIKDGLSSINSKKDIMKVNSNLQSKDKNTMIRNSIINMKEAEKNKNIIKESKLKLSNDVNKETKSSNNANIINSNNKENKANKVNADFSIKNRKDNKIPQTNLIIINSNKNNDIRGDDNKIERKLRSSRANNINITNIIKNNDFNNKNTSSINKVNSNSISKQIQSELEKKNLTDNEIYNGVMRESNNNNIPMIKDTFGEVVDKLINKKAFIYKDKFCKDCTKILTEGKLNYYCYKSHKK